MTGKPKIIDDLSNKEVGVFYGYFFPKTYAFDDKIVREGEEGRNLFVIQRGRVSVRVGSKVVATLEVGDSFGEVALIDGGKRSASVLAVEPEVLVASISIEDFNRFVRDHPSIATRVSMNIMRILCEKMRSADVKIRELSDELRSKRSPLASKVRALAVGAGLLS